MMILGVNFIDFFLLILILVMDVDVLPFLSILDSLSHSVDFFLLALSLIRVLLIQVLTVLFFYASWFSDLNVDFLFLMRVLILLIPCES